MTAFALSQKKEKAPDVQIGIGEKDRRKIAEGLSHVLADTYFLYLKTQNYHWNVTGPFFQSLHQMFEEHYTELASAIDEIAERIRALGHPAPGTFAEFSRLSTVREEEEVPAAEKMAARLLDGHEAVLRTIRSVLPAAEKGDDQASIDLLTQRLDVHEKSAWMLRSLLSA